MTTKIYSLQGIKNTNTCEFKFLDSVTFNEYKEYSEIGMIDTVYNNVKGYVSSRNIKEDELKNKEIETLKIDYFLELQPLRVMVLEASLIFESNNIFDEKKTNNGKFRIDLFSIDDLSQKNKIGILNIETYIGNKELLDVMKKNKLVIEILKEEMEIYIKKFSDI